MFIDKVLEFGKRSNDALVALGLPKPTRPQNELEFPADLSTLCNEDLGLHLSYWASMCAYAQQKVAILEGSLILAREEADQECDLRLYSKIKSGVKVTEAKVTVNSTKTVRDLKKQISIIEADLKLLKSVLIGYDLKNSAISREITRRNTDRFKDG